MIKEDAREGVEAVAAAGDGAELRAAPASRSSVIAGSCERIRRSTRSTPTTSQRVAGRRRARVPSGRRRRSSRRAPSPCEHLRVVRSGAVEIIARRPACSTCSARASCSATPRCCRACRPASRLAPCEDTTCYRIDADVAAGAAGAPGGLRFVARSLLEHAGDLTRWPPRREPRDPAAPAGRRRCCAPAGSCARPTRRSARPRQRMTAERRHVRRRRARRRIARHPHRPRSAHAGGRGGAAAATRPCRPAMSAPAYTVRARPARRRRPARDARPRLSPLARWCRRPASCSGSSRTSTWSPRTRARRSTCASGSRRAQTVEELVERRP